MKKKQLTIPVDVCTYDELTDIERTLIDLAKQATTTSYAPYSHFNVGAAILLDNDELVVGSNQENAAYPSGTCAERTAMFYANSRYPDSRPVIMAIASYSNGAFTPFSISPCGACRQVLIEAEHRFDCDISILLYGDEAIYRLRSAKDLMPLAFTQDALK